tara:strand:- start:1469 stop:2050 length:582 start_codon:yes stop_codon:yes gene_type:complete
MIEKQFIFPTQVFRASYNNAQELQRAVVPLLLQKEKKDSSPVRYTANGYTSYGAENILATAGFEDLRNFIDACVQECHKETKLQHTPSLKSSWFSINRKYTYHEEHNHLPDTWSGVYYIQADQDHPGLTLVNPNMKANWPRVNVSELNEANSPNVTCAAMTGSLIIFPSHLHHKIEQQIVDKERIMVAFNYGF